MSRAALKSESGGQISNVRVFYNGGISFVDYPSASLGSRPRWDIIHMDEVTSSAEALKVAKQEYEKNKAAPMSITAKIQRLSDNHTLDGANDTMLNGARFGYIADQSRTVPRSYDGSTYVEDKAWAWFSLYGGNLFPGAVNALDGKVGDSAYQSGANVSWDNNYFWYGSHSLSNALQIVHIPRNMPKTTDKTANSGYINAVTVSPDGSLCASGGKDGTAMLWDLNEGKHLYSLEANAIIHSMVFSPNRYWLCAATDTCIKIWDLESKSIVDELTPEFPVVGKKAMVHHCISLCWSADGSTLFSGYTDCAIRVWSVGIGSR